MQITELRREYRHKQGHWIAFDYKKNLYEVISEEIFRTAIDYHMKDTQVVPKLNTQQQIIGFEVV